MLDLSNEVTEHEFGVAENETIGGLAGWMKITGVMNMIWGALFVLLGSIALFHSKQPVGLGYGIEGALLLVVGAWLAGGARAFLAVVQTEGSDITNLMIALRKLSSVYKLQAILWIMACLLIVLAIVLAVLAHG